MVLPLVGTWIDRTNHCAALVRASPIRLARSGFMLLLASFSAMADDVPYVVNAGDNPWSISTRYLHSIDLWPRLIKHNRIANSRRIQPGTVLKIPESWLVRRGAPATALAVEGKVMMTDAQGRQSRLEAGGQIPEGAILHTGAEDNVSLSLLDNSRMLVKGNSELRLEANSEILHGKARSILIDLRRGALENQVEKSSSSGGRFEIRTPAAIAAVRGTSFRVAANPEKTSMEVLQGGVQLGNEAGVVELQAGFATSATPEHAPEPARALLPAPDLAGLPLRIERVPIDLPIPALAGATAYRTQIAADEQFATLLFDQTTSIPVTRVRDLPDADYHLRVRGVEATGLEGFDARHRLTIDARPEPPYLIVPAEGARLAEAKPNFGWTRRQSAATYRIQIARDASFDTLLLDQREVAGDTFRAPEELAAGLYFWRVAAIDPNEGQGPFGAHQTLRRTPAAPAMELQSKDQKPSIRWQPGGPDERFQLQVARDGGFADPVLDITSAASDYALPALADGGYHLRARTIAGDGYVGDWGAVQQFEIDTRSSPAWLLLLLPLLGL